MREHEAELKAAGVVSLSLFGSAARNDPKPADVDVAVRLGAGFSKGGFDYFGRLDELQHRLAEILSCDVDVIAEPVRKERLQKEIDRDRVLAF